jgi:heat shock protein HslJ
MDGSKVKKEGPGCEFAACPEGVETQESFLLSHDWAPTKIDGAAVQAGRAFLRFEPEEGSFSGNGGCNFMSGSYTINGDQISFGQTAITMMYCEDSADLEGKVLGKINGGPYRLEIANNELNFYKGENLEIVWGIRG